MESAATAERMNGAPGNAATVVTAAALLMNCLLLNFMSSLSPSGVQPFGDGEKKPTGRMQSVLCASMPGLIATSVSRSGFVVL